MGINRFFKPAVPGEVTPINWGLMYQMKKDRDAKEEDAFNKGLDFKSKLVGIKALPGKDTELANSTINSVNSIFDKYQNNLGDKQSRRAMYSELANINVPGVAAKLSNNYNQYNAYNAEKAKLIEKNLWKDRYITKDTKEPILSDNPQDNVRMLGNAALYPEEGYVIPTKTVKKQYKFDPLEDYNASNKEVFDYVPEAYHNPVPSIQEQYFRPIKDSILSKSKKDYLGNQIIEKGVSSDDINNVVEKNIDNVLSTPEGKTLIEQQREALGEKAYNMSDRDVLRIGMQAAGESFIRNDEDLRRYNIDEDALRRSRDVQQVMPQQQPTIYTGPVSTRPVIDTEKYNKPLSDKPWWNNIGTANTASSFTPPVTTKSNTADWGSTEKSNEAYEASSRIQDMQKDPILANILNNAPEDIQKQVKALSEGVHHTTEHATSAYNKITKYVDKLAKSLNNTRSEMYSVSMYPEDRNTTKPNDPTAVYNQKDRTNMFIYNANMYKVYDPEKQRLLDNDEIQGLINDELSKKEGERLLKVTGNFTPYNGYSVLLGDNSFSHAENVNIGGKNYVTTYNTDDSRYGDAMSQSYLTAKQYQPDTKIKEPTYGKDYNIYVKYNSDNNTISYYDGEKEIVKSNNPAAAFDALHSYLRIKTSK